LQSFLHQLAVELIKTDVPSHYQLSIKHRSETISTVTPKETRLFITVQSQYILQY
jgi:hypothetical protein